MKKLLFLLVIVVLATLELVWPSFLNFFSCKPDLLLVFTVALVFYTDFRTALLLGALCGLTKDAFLPWGPAINALCFSLWSYAVHRISRQISTEENYVRLGIVLVVSLFNNLVIGLYSLTSGIMLPAGIFLRNLILISIYTVIISPLIFKLTKKIAA